MLNLSDGLFVTSVLICFALGMVTGSEMAETEFQRSVAQTSCAQYSPTTGKFEWLE